MSQISQSVSDFVEQKQGVAKSGDKSLKRAFDEGLAIFLLNQMKEKELVYCPFSSRVVPKTETVTAAYVYWEVCGGTKTVACVENSQRDVWLLYELPKTVSRLKAASNREFNQWVATGGLHVADQWWGPNREHEMPSEFTVVKMVDEQLQVYLHLYNRWVKLNRLCDADRWKPRDLRRENILEQLTTMADSRMQLPRTNREKKILEYFGLPEPFDYWTFGGADGHRDRCRDTDFYRQCHFL